MEKQESRGRTQGDLTPANKGVPRPWEPRAGVLTFLGAEDGTAAPPIDLREWRRPARRVGLGFR
jgi:hypothetical protein